MSAAIRQPAWIGIGSNLGDAVQQVRQALEALGALPGSELISHSRLYRTEPLPSPVSQEDYINAAALIHTDLAPAPLLARLLEIERSHGRKRGKTRQKNHPRALDLDLLLYNRLALSEPGLNLPHPRIAGRGFVLIPLLDIDQNLQMPNGQSIKTLSDNLNHHGIIGYFDQRYRYHPYRAAQHQPLCIQPVQKAATQTDKL